MPNYNVAVYDYPTYTQVRAYNKPIKVSSDLEKYLKQIEKRKEKENTENIEKKEKIKTKEEEQKDAEHSHYESCRRSKDNLYNIVNSNKWEYFITLTFDYKGTKTGKKIDSDNYEVVYQKLSTFLKNFKYRNSSKLQYVIVPELHEDKKHFHLHGLLANCDELHFEDSGHKTDKGDTIYNIINWSYGFTTATKVNDNDKVCSYIAKYMSKDNLVNIPNRHRYLCSRGLNRVKPKKLNTNIDQYLIKAFKNRELTYCTSVKCKNAHRVIKYYKFDKNTNI